MNSKSIAFGILRAVGVISITVLILFFLYQIRSVIAYCLIAGVISLLGRPIALFFRRKLRFNNIVAVVLTLLIILLVLAGIFALFVPVIANQSDQLALLNIGNLEERLNNLLIKILQYFGTTEATVNEIVVKADIKNTVVDGLNIGFIPKFLSAVVDIVGTIGIGLFSVLFIAFFFLKDSRMIQQGILNLIPVAYKEKTKHAIAESKLLLSRYFLGLLLQMTILFVFYAIGMLLSETKNGLIIALICALFNVIPYLGPLVGGAIMVLFAATNNIEMDFSTVILPKILFVSGGFIIGQLIDNFFSQPIIFSNSVKSHPLEIFLIIIIAGLLFGVVGLIIAIPAYTIIKVTVKEFFINRSVVSKQEIDPML